MPRRSHVSATRNGLANTDILASTKLSARDIRQMISCFAKGMTPKQTMAETKLSHVTVYRFFSQLRRRLLDVGVFTSLDAYCERVEREEEESDIWFDYEALKRALSARRSSLRGMKAHNSELYMAHAIFDFENEYTPAEFQKLILAAITAGGPVNRPTRPIDPIHLHKTKLAIRVQQNRRPQLNCDFASINALFGALLAKFEVFSEDFANMAREMGNASSHNALPN